MERKLIKQSVLQVYKDCCIHSFPVSCSSILAYYGLKIYSYSELKQKSSELYEICKKYSDDAFLFQDLICYNETKPLKRLRFSLMHELGHIILNTENEVSANQFASHLLAPRSILKKSGLTKPDDISLLFDISKEAATYALRDTQSASDDCQEIDTLTLEHFYRKDLQIYVYRIKECPICGSYIYNSIKDTCLQCKNLSRKSR